MDEKVPVRVGSRKAGIIYTRELVLIFFIKA